MTSTTRTALTWTLLAVRFLVELVVFVGPVVIAVRAIGGAAGLVVGLVAAALVVALWGVALSPRRRVDAPIGVRAAIEAALVLLVAVGLAGTGLVVLAAALVVVEIVAVGWLWTLGLPPGADAAAP